LFYLHTTSIQKQLHLQLCCAGGLSGLLAFAFSLANAFLASRNIMIPAKSVPGSKLNLKHAANIGVIAG